MNYLKLQRSIFSRANDSQRHLNEGLYSFIEEDFQVYIPKTVSEFIIFPKVKFNRLLFIANVLINTRYFLTASKQILLTSLVFNTATVD